MNQKLEECLQTYCQTKDSDFFEENLYEAFKAYAASICLKWKIPSRDINNMVTDLVSHAAIELPKKYDPKREKTAKGMLYVLMNQLISKKIKYDTRGKRDCRKLLFVEEIEDYGIVSLLEIEMNDLTKMREVLIENRHMFEKLDTVLQRTIAKEIVKVIQTLPDNDNYITFIAKQCKCSLNVVYQTIQLMHRLLVIE